MATQKKIETVQELTDKVARARAIIMTDYQGLAHKQLEDLRKLLKKVGSEFAVTKNTLLKKALAEHKKTISDTSLNSATGAIFAYEDEVTPVKELVKFFKAATKGTIKAGLLGTQELSADQVDRLATLPPKNVLLAQLVGQLQAPMYGLHNALSWNLKKLVWTLDAVKSKKTT